MTTSHTCNNAGELAGTDYLDGTPDVSHAYARRDARRRKPLLPLAGRFKVFHLITMPINTKPSGDGLELFLAGRVDGAMANELEVAILAAVRGGAKSLYINMAEATFLCSAGLRVLLQYWRQTIKSGNQFFVTNPSAEVDSVLTMTGFREQMVEGGQT